MLFSSNYKNRKQPSVHYITTYSGTKLREIAICTIFFNLFSLFQYFLDRLYTSRISSRMLINQHTALFTELENVRKKFLFNEIVTQIFFQSNKNLNYYFFQANSVKSLDGSGASSMFGSIDTKCEIAPIIESAYKVCLHLFIIFFSVKLQYNFYFFIGR